MASTVVGVCRRDAVCLDGPALASPADSSTTRLIQRGAGDDVETGERDKVGRQRFRAQCEECFMVG